MKTVTRILTKAGKRDDLGDIHFRSAWEANYARILNLYIANGIIDRWEYEPETFWFEKIKRGIRSYKPDFKLYKDDEVWYVEVKGYMDSQSKTKLKRMRIYYPKIKIDVVDKKRYKILEKQLKGLIKNWE